MNTGTVQWPGESWMQEVENLKIVQHRQTAEAGVCVVASALAVPSPGNTLPLETLLDGFSLVGFSSNVPCSTEKPSLATPVEAAWSYSLATFHVSFSPQHSPPPALTLFPSVAASFLADGRSRRAEAVVGLGSIKSPEPSTYQAFNKC